MGKKGKGAESGRRTQEHRRTRARVRVRDAHNVVDTLASFSGVAPRHRIGESESRMLGWAQRARRGRNNATRYHVFFLFWYWYTLWYMYSVYHMSCHWKWGTEKLNEKPFTTSYMKKELQERTNERVRFVRRRARARFAFLYLFDVAVLDGPPNFECFPLYIPEPESPRMRMTWTETLFFSLSLFLTLVWFLLLFIRISKPLCGIHSSLSEHSKCIGSNNGWREGWSASIRGHVSALEEALSFDSGPVGHSRMLKTKKRAANFFCFDKNKELITGAKQQWWWMVGGGGEEGDQKAKEG